MKLDIRDAEAVEDVMAQTISKFGNLDIVINNVSERNTEIIFSSEFNQRLSSSMYIFVFFF